VRRLFAASLWAKKMIDSGQLGVVRRIRWREGAPYDWPLVSPSLFVPDVAGGGVLIDGGSHIFDLMLWWLNARAANRVRYRDSSLGGVESEVIADLTIGPAEVSLELSRLRLLSNTCEISGDKGSVEFGIDVDSPYTTRDRSGQVVDKGMVAAVSPAQSEWERLFSEQLRNFAAAARGDEQIYAGPDDGKAVTALIASCYAAREPIPMPWREVHAL
jgi:predicted dehydrogenase